MSNFDIKLQQEMDAFDVSQYKKLILEELNLKLRKAIKDAYQKRGDTEWEKGKVDGLLEVIGKGELKNIFEQVRNKIEKGVAEQSVPK